MVEIVSALDNERQSYDPGRIQLGHMLVSPVSGGELDLESAPEPQSNELLGRLVRLPAESGAEV